jgi:type IV pilus assembly protein PilB
MEKKGFIEAICSILEKNNIITSSESNALKKNFKDRSQIAFDDFLLEEGLVEREDILEALSTYYKVPYMDPIGYFFDHYLLIKFPKDFLLRNLILPLEVLDDNILVVVANDPSNEELLPAIGKYVSYDIEFLVGIASEIIESVEEFYDRSLTDPEIYPDIYQDTDPQKLKEIEEEARKEIEETPEEK